MEQVCLQIPKLCYSEDCAQYSRLVVASLINSIIDFHALIRNARMLVLQSAMLLSVLFPSWYGIALW